MFSYFAIRRLTAKVESMAGELEALKAAVQKDAETDAKLEAYLATVVTNLADLSKQLSDLKAQETIDPAAVQAIADQLNAHADEVASHLPPSAPAA